MAAPAGLAADGRALVRVVTCGSVDDGKSTLLGRLLFDAGLVPDDQLAALERDSRGRPCSPEGLDLSLLFDGLAAEREQGITIDVAYRYVSTPRRRFVFADSPGHEQYTRNMATAASTASAAILLVDARRGVRGQTRRHAAILKLLGVERVAAVVNKMDLVDDAPARAAAIGAELERFADEIGLPPPTVIPVSALNGDNVVRRAEAQDWPAAPTLLEWLEDAIPPDAQPGPFRMPVQWVNRAHADFRGLSGTVASGSVRPGDVVAVAGTERRARVSRILALDQEADEAAAGDAVTVVLEDDVDVGRGDMLVDADRLPSVADQFAADLIWMGDEPLIPERTYLLRIGTTLVGARVTRLRHELSTETLEELAAATLGANRIGACNLALDRPVAFEPYERSRELGAFVLIERETFATVGAGMIRHALSRATNVVAQRFDLDRAGRAALMGQRPLITWLTGLSGAGKSTIANAAEQMLAARGYRTYVLDGDNLRRGLTRDLGFTEADRVENIRRAAETARLMADAGLVVLVALISPFRRERAMAREIAGDIPFLEVFVDAPIATCETRDAKGLYAKARAGLIPNFTGIGSPYEPPEAADVHLRTADRPVAEVTRDLVEAILPRVEGQGRQT